MEDFKVNKNQKTEEQEVREARKELQLIDSSRLVPGLNVFELNLKTFGVRQIKPESKDVEVIDKKNMLTGQSMKGFGTKMRVKYTINENCLYVQAINLKKASEKFEKHLDKAILEENFSNKVGK
jgi:hypothetical protein